MPTTLLIDPAMGMAGDMFSAALIDLGAPEETLIRAMLRTARLLGEASIQALTIPTPEGSARRLQISLTANHDHLHASQARELLAQAIDAEGLTKPYATFARRALDILIEAEQHAHAHHPALQKMISHTHHHGPLHPDHHHNHDEAALHEAQDILLDVMGAAVGLQALDVDMNDILCFMPVAVGGGVITFSHGALSVPAPATEAILKKHRIPQVAGPVDVELLTPTGAAILAALHPIWQCRQPLPEEDILARGTGLGTRNLRPLNALHLALVNKTHGRAP